MKSIAPKLFAVMIALGASSAVCASVNLHGEAGAEFTNLSASFGAGEPGMTFNTQWAHMSAPEKLKRGIFSLSPGQQNC